MNLLGRPFKLPGVVVHGDKSGRTIGFPTANVKPTEGHIYSCHRCICGEIQVQDKWHDGVCNVGYKPTLITQNEKQLSY